MKQVHTRDTHARTCTAHLVDVFEFVYYLADDRLGGFIASGLGAGVQSLQARSGEPDRTETLSQCLKEFH